MDQQIQEQDLLRPDYKRIFSDIIKRNFPEKKQQCDYLLSKEDLSLMDVIAINNIIFNKVCKNTLAFNQRHRSYDRSTILEILEYQNMNKLNNCQLASHFRLSRNTVSKWKREFSNPK